MRLNQLLTAITTLLVFGNTVFAQQYRLKKIESYKLTLYSSPNFQKTDSSVFYYTGNRGGYYTAEQLSQYIKKSLNSNEYFYTSNNIIKCDSIDRSNWREDNGLLTQNKIVQQFDNLNNTIYYHNKWKSPALSMLVDSAVYTYNGSQITQSYSKSNGTYNYIYNLSRQLDSIISDNGKPYMTYTYNSNFSLQESTTFNSVGLIRGKKRYYYNSANMPDSVTEQYYDGLKWHDGSVTVYTYTTSPNTTIEDYSASSAPGSPITKRTRFINFYNTLGRLDSVYLQTYSGSNYNNFRRYRYYYNTANLLDSFIMDRWDGAQWANFADTTGIYCHKHHFTYEPYFPTSIATAQNIQIDLTSYPNPATDIIHLNAELPAQAAVTVGIYDAQGRLLRKQDAAPTKQLRMQMIVADLPAGIYVLRIDGKDISGSQQFIISR